jgi:hypothetical protein
MGGIVIASVSEAIQNVAAEAAWIASSPSAPRDDACCDHIDLFNGLQAALTLPLYAFQRSRRRGKARWGIRTE